jgi:hypothetical protein
MSPRKASNPNDFFPLALAAFPKYRRFRLAKKTVTISLLELRQAPKRPFLGRCELATPRSAVARFFEAEISPRQTLKYALKIFAPDFGDAPCLRFDSSGNDHLNEETGAGLPRRRVPAPHFHKVDKDGWLRAYHPHALSDPLRRAAIAKDVTLGTNLFCQEFKLVSPSGGLVVLKQIAAPLALSTTGAMDAAQFP